VCENTAQHFTSVMLPLVYIITFKVVIYMPAFYVFRPKVKTITTEKNK